jgi:DNA topoisomerase I
MQDPQNSAAMARAAGLIYVLDDAPGISRLRCGAGFRYVTPQQRRLRDSRQLRRIASLAIPPAYRHVWICPSPRGHLQATGRDARGRKQYRYHAAWRELRDYAKFERMALFAAALPKLRRQLHRDLSLEGLPQRKVLAAVATLLGITAARIGNAIYARDNHSFGIATLRNRHVSFLLGGRAKLSFTGKGGLPHEIIVDNRRIVRIVRECHALPGQHLFQYLDDENKRRPIDSGQVNDYLREAMGGDFTAKDFRTWHATVHALSLLRRAEAPEGMTDAAAKRTITAVVKDVARQLRNTPAVCRKSYINPDLFLAWRAGLIHSAFSADYPFAERRGEPGIRRFLSSQKLRRLAAGRRQD